MNLKEMTAKQAVRMAKEISGLTGKEVAGSLGVSQSIVKRYLKEDDAYFPRLEIIPDLCHVLGNDIIVQWLEARIKQERESRREKMLLHTAKMKKALKGIKLLLATEEEMAAEDEEELHDLVTKIARECLRMDSLLPRAPYQDVPGEKSAGRAAGTMRQVRHDRKR